MHPVVVIIAKKLAKLHKKLSAMKSRLNKIKIVLEILRLESLTPELTEIPPSERAAIQIESFKRLSLEQQNLIYRKNMMTACPKDPDLVLKADKYFRGDQKICEYFYSQFLVYSSL